MKACLMKVNYDPRYTTPHLNDNRFSLKNRLALAHEIYARSNAESKVRHGPWDDSVTRARTREKLTLDLSLQHASDGRKTEKRQSNDLYAKTGHEKGIRVERVEQHKEGVAKAHTTIRLQPLKPTSNKVSESHNTLLQKPLPVPQNMKSIVHKMKKGPYSPDKVYQRPFNPQIHSSFDKRNFFNPSKSADATSKVSHSSGGFCLTNRSRTTIGLYESRVVKSDAVLELEQKARREAETALRNKKIFTILGPYHGLRVALRRRGWVEKFTNAPPPSEISGKPSNQNNTETDDLQNKGTHKEQRVMPWEEDNGIYGMMSHVIRNCTPSLVFAVKTVDVNSRSTKSGQLVNHFGKASMFTTKSGLCQSLRSVQWYKDVDPDSFYPRCYKLDDEDDKENFIEDYRLTACMGLLKWFIEKYKEDEDEDEKEDEGKPAEATNPAPCPTSPANVDQNSSVPLDSSETSAAPSSASTQQSDSEQCEIVISPCADGEGPVVDEKHSSQESPPCTVSIINLSASPSPSPPKTPRVPVSSAAKGKVRRKVPNKAIDVALQQCQRFLRFKDHKDIDIVGEDDLLAETQWDKFLMWFYHCIHDDGYITSPAKEVVQQCELILSRIKTKWPQFLLDGSHNIWILKPGAKSRGRGIQCLDKLNEILKAAESSSSMVVQKYMERPLLVYKTKFDIRQWFMVTDWNPLTIWYYKHCYLRFCTQEFTLENFHESVHLSNNSVQKHYRNGIRSDHLPDDNMWSSEEFDEYLREKGLGSVWTDKIVPGMKKALLCSLLCTQEYIECRKSAFEVYGADFMVTEDLQPWLLEINCSPSMARNTRVTNVLVDKLLEDMVKVVLDRKTDKDCNTGGFECIYRQSMMHDPPGSDASLTVYGKKVRKPRR